MDKDRSGHIDKQELMAAIDKHKHQSELTEALSGLLVEAKDDALTFDAFQRMVRPTSVLTI